jgi:excisionase family DNA binding protein
LLQGPGGPGARKGPPLRVLDGGRDRLLSVRQVAERLGVCTRTIYELIDRGELPHIRISNAIRVAPADVAAYVAANRVGGGS